MRDIFFCSRLRPALISYVPVLALCFFLLPKFAVADRNTPKVIGISIPSPELLVTEKESGVTHCRVHIVHPSEGAHTGKWQSWTLLGDKCMAEFDAVEVQFVMPEHGHGSETRPRVEYERQKSKIVVSQVRLQMPGWWQCKVLFFKNGVSVDAVSFDLMIDP